MVRQKYLDAVYSLMNNEISFNNWVSVTAYFSDTGDITSNKSMPVYMFHYEQLDVMA